MNDRFVVITRLNGYKTWHVVVDGPAPSKWHGLAQRVRVTVPLVVGLFVVAVAYMTTRTIVVGELLGEKHLVPVHGVRRLWVMMAVVPQWLRLLVWPAHLSAEYSPRQIEIPEGPGSEIALGCAILLACVAAFVALGRGPDATRARSESPGGPSRRPSISSTRSPRWRSPRRAGSPAARPGTVRSRSCRDARPR